MLFPTGLPARPQELPATSMPTFTTLANFTGPNGAFPQSMSLIQGTDGSFYGTTASGGAYGHGEVFKITAAGKLTAVYSFDCYNGDSPNGLVQARNGNFYGTTSAGGANNGGTVFELTSGGRLTTLYNFCSQKNCADGAEPNGGLIQAHNGSFYGTTSKGGNPTCSTPGGCGTVFEITPAGALTALHVFDGFDGAYPMAGLIQATNGNLYGTTAGGTGSGGYGDGTVFEITPGGTLTILHSFEFTDGAYPDAALIQAKDGNLYGTTLRGGAYSDGCTNQEDYSYGCGTVFKITPGGTLTTVYNFPDCLPYSCPGYGPVDALVQASDGNFYGTTYYGCPATAMHCNRGLGTVFEITPGGALTTLHVFDGTDGAYPSAGLLQATSGTFYGTTYEGGTNEEGTVFSLDVGLGPFVEIRSMDVKTPNPNAVE